MTVLLGRGFEVLIAFNLIDFGCWLLAGGEKLAFHYFIKQFLNTCIALWLLVAFVNACFA